MSPFDNDAMATQAGEAAPERKRRVWPVLTLFAACVTGCFLADAVRFQAPPPERLELEFSLPLNPRNRREPLITTGVSGSGDFLFVQYREAGTLVFGYDSWGAGGPFSAPIKAKPGQLLKLRIAMPSLVKLATGKMPRTLEVAVEGGDTWRAEVSAHPCEAGSVQWAVNRIGGTSCADVLSGTLRRADGALVRGTGAGGYYSFGERVALRVQTIGWNPLWYAAIAALAAWLCAFVIPWAVLGSWLRRLMEVPAWAQPETGDEGNAHGKYEEKEAFGWLRIVPARPFIAGCAFGFLACVGLGYMVGHEPLFRSFVRFFQPIQPQTYFYPTARELVAQIEGTVRRDKILVLVGGASYFRGTGQNPGELWTHELQRLLGERYVVVNFAIDQAGPSAFAAVVFQALQKTYPKIIYVCSGSPFLNDPLDGGDVYRYLYWDAYYKGMLGMDPLWKARVEDLIGQQMATEAGSEMHLGKRLDAMTFACDLWTWVGYKYLSTVWTDSYPLHPFRARHRYVEGDDILMKEHQLGARRDEAMVRLLEERNLGASKNGYLQTSDGRWVLDPQTRSMIADQYGQMLPPAVRSRSLVVLVHANPYFMKTLTREDRRRFEEVTTLAQGVMEEIGYQVVQAGKDFSEDDFVDGGHFMPSGGNKVARIVAEKIARMQP